MEENSKRSDDLGLSRTLSHVGRKLRANEYICNDCNLRAGELLTVPNKVLIIQVNYVILVA